MRGGGGIDGQVHRLAGRAMVQELMRVAPHGCKTGQAVLTPGFGLRQKWVVHTPGPVWLDGESGEAALLESCYRTSFGLAERAGARSIGFCGISTGIYGYPLEEAIGIGIRTVDRCLDGSKVEAAVFAMYREDEFEAATDVFRRA
ncbi:MAG: macro domain-containing protein [Armatimonadetes bacterium]|nr:macro domain-containing protein [Armatimonadota bacterium]